MADGLSDALRQMADGEHAPAAPSREPAMAGARRPTAPTPRPNADAGVFDESGTDAGAQATPSVRPRRTTPPSTGGGLKLVGAVLLLAMGLVMAAMGTWATLILADFDVWRSEQPGARTVALALLVTFPIALCLLTASAFLLRRGLKG